MVTSGPIRKGFLVTRSTVAQEFDVHKRTVDRWEDDPALGFPKSVLIKGQRFFQREEIDAWKDELFRSGLKAAVEDRRDRAAELSSPPADDRHKRGRPEVAVRRERAAGPGAPASADPAATASAAAAPERP